MKFGRRNLLSPKTLSGTGVPEDARLTSLVLSAFRVQSHQCAARLSIEHARTGDRNIILLKCINERRIIHYLRALKPREDDRKIIPGIRREFQNSAFR